MSRASRRVVVPVLAGVLLFVSALGTLAQGEKDAPLPKEITWKVQALDQAPTKVVSARFDARKNIAFWVLELTRDLTMDEDGADWAPAFRDGGQAFVTFELQDADGIVMKRGQARYYGEYVYQKGKRFGVVLEIPKDVAPYVKTVEAVGK